MMTKVMTASSEAIRQLLQRKSLQGVIVVEEASVNWLFQGHYHIGVATSLACVEVLVTLDRIEVLVNSIEAERLLFEQNLKADQVIIYPWYDETIRKDTLERWRKQPGVFDESAMKEDLASLRYVFTEDRQDQAIDLGRDASEAMEEVCFQVVSNHTESEVAGRLAEACLQRGMEPIVNLVASARRAGLYRHFTPTHEKLGDYAIVSVGARRQGMIVSMTRMVFFDRVSTKFRQRYEAVLHVHAALLRHSRPGQTLGQAFQAGVKAYEDAGFAREWMQHHQGGLAGYLPRELKATQDTALALQEHMMVSWNPTIQGVKAEDTYLLLADHQLSLTKPLNWPMIKIEDQEEVFEFPDLLLV